MPRISTNPHQIRLRAEPARGDQGEEGAGRGGGDSESGQDDAVVPDHDTQSVEDRMEPGEGGDGKAGGGATAMRITCSSESWLQLARSWKGKGGLRRFELNALG